MWGWIGVERNHALQGLRGFGSGDSVSDAFSSF